MFAIIYLIHYLVLLQIMRFMIIMIFFFRVRMLYDKSVGKYKT